MIVLNAALSLVTAYLLAAAAFPLLWLPRAFRWPAFLLLAILLLACPLITPARYPLARLVVAGFAIILTMKVWDLIWRAAKVTKGNPPFPVESRPFPFVTSHHLQELEFSGIHQRA